MQQRRRFIRTFTVSFLLSGCVLGLGAAFLYIGYNHQITAKGEAAAAVTYTIQGGKLCPADPLTGEPLRLIAENPSQTLSILSPAPFRLAFSLLEQEIGIAVSCWQKLPLFAEGEPCG